MLLKKHQKTNSKNRLIHTQKEFCGFLSIKEKHYLFSLGEAALPKMDILYVLGPRKILFHPRLPYFMSF